MAKHNECVQAILAELDKYGFVGSVLERGKHLEVQWNLSSGSRRSIFTSCTPSDWRAPLNERARVRRMMRDDKIDVPTKTVVTFERAMSLPKPVLAPDDRIKSMCNDLDAAIDLIFELREQITAFSDKLNSLQVVTTVTFGKQESVADAPVVEQPAPSEKIISVRTLAPGEVQFPGVYRKHARAVGHSSVDVILAYLKDGQYHQTADIIKDAKLGVAVTNQALRRLRKRGLVEHGLRGMWRKVPTHRAGD